METLPENTSSAHFTCERDYHIAPWCPLGRRNLLVYLFAAPPLVLFAAHAVVFGAALLIPLPLAMWHLPAKSCTCTGRLRAQQAELALCLED